MPVMDGYEATKLIRKLEELQKRPRMPIAAFTAHALKGEEEKCRAAGMDDFIAKPARQSDVERVLTQWLSSTLNSSNTTPPEVALPSTSTDILDKARFHALSELMEDGMKEIGLRYLETANEYLSSIETAFTTRDAKAIAQASHPLKSSSLQLGSVIVSDIAKEMEFISKSPSPDWGRLEELMPLLRIRFKEAEQALRTELNQLA